VGHEAGTGEMSKAEQCREKAKEKHLEELGIEGVTITETEVFTCRGCCVGLVANLLLPANFTHTSRQSK